MFGFHKTTDTDTLYPCTRPIFAAPPRQNVMPSVTHFLLPFPGKGKKITRGWKTAGWAISQGVISSWIWMLLVQCSAEYPSVEEPRRWKEGCISYMSRAMAVQGNGRDPLRLVGWLAGRLAGWLAVALSAFLSLCARPTTTFGISPTMLLSVRGCSKHNCSSLVLGQLAIIHFACYATWPSGAGIFLLLPLCMSNHDSRRGGNRR